MLQVNFLRNNIQLVKQQLEVKHFKQIDIVDEIIMVDDDRKKLQNEFDNMQATLNASSKDIGRLMASGDKEAVESVKIKVAALKKELEPKKQNMAAVEKKLHNLLTQLPNLPHISVPKGKTPEENETVRSGGKEAKFDFEPLPHWDLARKYKLIDFDLGNKITGSGFPVYTGQGAKLQRALIQYFLDFNTSAGYMEYLPPYMVNADSAFATGQLPDKEGQMYYINEDDFYLIPTAEVPVTNIYRDVILKHDELPVKMTAYSPCFRREAGSYGKDVRGLNRLHQFEKVEIIQITTPENSYAVLEQMVDHVEQLVNSLQLPYRILKLCGGDMGFASALTYDFEVYSAAQQRWLEVSSVSNFESFQTNRMKCRYKDENGKTQLAHSLNGSSLALPRIMAALLENHQQPDYIEIPSVLIQYFGKEKISQH